MRVPFSPLPIFGAFLLFIVLSAPAGATLDLFPGESWNPGTDGVLAPSANYTVDLSLASTGNWNSVPPASGYGVYDPEKRAVVFKYQSVYIPTGVTVTFKNHVSRAPVVWLVDGNVDIRGTLSANGFAFEVSTGKYSQPGPGGFRGGAGRLETLGASMGLGPGGGGDSGVLWGVYSGTTTNPDSSSYGNEQIIPLLGGSGGSASQIYGGASGGGAILIAATESISLSGVIKANGGPSYSGDTAIAGSGGAVRIIADSFSGNGAVIARWQDSYTIDGRNGRIRIENKTGTFSGTCTPVASQSLPGTPPLIWPPETYPSVKIKSVGGVNTPASPMSREDFPNTDVNLTGSAGLVTVLAEAKNMPAPVGWAVRLRIVPRSGGDSSMAMTYVSGNATSSIWKADVSLPDGLIFLQVRASKQ